MDSGSGSSPKIADADNHEIDLDDDDDDNDNDERNNEAISVPIIIGNKPKTNMESGNYPYGDEQQSGIRTTIMYGRPSVSMAQTSMSGARYFPQGPQSPISAMLAAAAAAANRQATYRRLEMAPASSESQQQPQRLILLITHREPVQQRVQFVSREEQPST